MLPRNHPDHIQSAFDDHRRVANARLILPATLALRLGLPQLLAPVQAEPPLYRQNPLCTGRTPFVQAEPPVIHG